jgi:molecular chaperone HscB
MQKKSMTHFELMRVNQEYSIDLNELERTFYDMQRKFHPDRFIRKSAQGRLNAQLYAASLNEAYSVLKSPLKRAEYILKLHGCDKEQNDPELLMEVMELREQISELQGMTAIENMKKSLKNKSDKIIDNIGASFKKDDYAAAKNHCLYLKYIEKMMNELDQSRRQMRLAS